ncbi:MAG: hypothetical protein J7559_06380, partial [Cohnella sp.]|nr:hypothetical protein [Cohnella sp.]
MIVATRERYLPTLVNTMVLSMNGWYFYLHRDVYDQAVILTDRYDTFDSLAQAIGCEGAEGEATARWFYDHTPKPLRVLAPFLQLIDGTLEQDMELCCGVLHVVTAMIHVKGFPEKPPEVRRSVSFSLTIREEYELAWERFIQSAVPYEKRHASFNLGVGEAVQRVNPPFAIPVTDTVPLFPSFQAHEDD